MQVVSALCLVSKFFITNIEAPSPQKWVCKYGTKEKRTVHLMLPNDEAFCDVMSGLN